jgi:type IX secretion system PorP/SprF family membrane protein
MIINLFASQAQDVHYSQFHVSPMLQNPANAGYFNCDYRFTSIYKSQWKSITVPYNTFAASYDMRFVKNKKSKNLFGLGATIYNDKAGDGNFTHTNFGLTGSVHHFLDRFNINTLGGGLTLAYGGGNIDFNKLSFGDQYIAPGSSKQFSAETPFNGFNYFDISAGLEYNWIPQTRTNHIQVGFAAFHLNRPKKSFRGDNDSRIERKYNFHASSQLRLNSHLQLFPKVQASFQGVNHEILLGTFARFDLDKMKNDKYGVYIGIWQRIGDAFIIVSRLDIDKLSIAFSYDVTTSNLNDINTARGGPEISIIFIGCLPKQPSKGAFCPRF